MRPLNALRGLGPVETLRIAASYAKARLLPHPKEHTFEEWVSNRFGRRLFEIFFKTYTEKVWGLKCNEIGADWASQRIKNLDLVAALKDMVVGSKDEVTSLIRQFRYPRLGPGMMWEKVAGILGEKGVPVHMGYRVTKVHLSADRVTAVTAVDRDGRELWFAGEHFISSMPIKDLIAAMSPPPPDSVMAAAESLRYRDFLTVGLVIDKPELFKDNWIYIHSPDVKVGRIQNFKNWSPDMVPDPSRTSLGLEFFVQEGDELWNASDEALIDLATRECVGLGFVEEQDVVEGVVIRMPKAYPVYDDQYKAHLARIRAYLQGIANLQLVGRNGQHRYNNQDHSMLTAIYAARNVAGAELDVWDVNLEPDYHEGAEEGRERVTERLVPQRKAAP